MKNNRLAIIGAGELGNQVLHYARLQGKYEVVGFIDDTKDLGSVVDGLPVLGRIDNIDKLRESYRFEVLFIAIGYKHFEFRNSLYTSLKKRGYRFGTIIAPHVWIDPSASIGDGCIIYPCVKIDKETVIEDMVIVNINATVCHNSVIHKNTYISPCVAIAGYCSIGESCMIGINATIRDHILVCNDVIIGQSSIITKNIEASGTYIGVNQRVK